MTTQVGSCFSGKQPRAALNLACAILCLVTQLCRTLCDPVVCSPPDSCVHGDSPGKNTEMGHHSLLQGIFPSQGSNPGLPHCRQILYHLSHQGSPWWAWPGGLETKVRLPTWLCLKSSSGGPCWSAGGRACFRAPSPSSLLMRLVHCGPFNLSCTCEQAHLSDLIF